MSLFKTTFSRALAVYKSDNAVIPYPGLVNTSNSCTSFSTNKLIDTNGKFKDKNVYIGDVVYNTTLKTAATVLNVDSNTQLTLNADIFTANAQEYTIYSMSSQANIGQRGAFLYVGGAGNVSVTTIGGDTVLFSGVPAGTTLPIQIATVNSTTGGTTTATLLTAMW